MVTIQIPRPKNLEDISLHPEPSCPRSCTGCYLKSGIKPSSQVMDPEWIANLVHCLDDRLYLTIHINSTRYLASIAHTLPVHTNIFIMVDALQYLNAGYITHNILKNVAETYISVHNETDAKTLIDIKPNQRHSIHIAGLSIISGQISQQTMTLLRQAFPTTRVYLLLQKLNDGKSLDRYKQWINDWHILGSGTYLVMDGCIFDFMNQYSEIDRYHFGCLGSHAIDIRPGGMWTCPFKPPVAKFDTERKPAEVLRDAYQIFNTGTPFNCDPTTCDLISGKELDYAKKKIKRLNRAENHRSCRIHGDTTQAYARSDLYRV